MSRRWRLAVSLVVALCLPGPSRADLAREMNSMFGSMVSESPPGVFSTARRGVISGGNLAINNRIVNTNLVSITPPGFKAGCGGIDFFGGSFSFINAAQFQALLKAIAANAAGYAFQLALAAMCPSCAATIDALEKKIQQLIRQFSNSCQIAQGAVNDVASALTGQENNKASLINMVSNTATDAFDAFTTALSGQNPINRALTGAPNSVAQQIQGNITWRALAMQNASTWFQAGDNSLLETLMNIGGTVIVGNLSTDSLGTGSQNLNVQTITGRPDLMTSLVEGGTINILACDTRDQDGCLGPTMTSVTLTGFQQMLLQAFEGTGGSSGIIAKVGGGAALTTQEQAALGMLPNGLGGLIVRLASKSGDAARGLVETCAPQIALIMAKALVNDMLRAVRASIAASQDTRAKDVAKLLDESWQGVRAEELQLQTRYGSLEEVVTAYQSLMGVTQPPATAFANAVSAMGIR